MALRQMNFTGQPPQGVGGGYPPRGIYSILVTSTSSETAESGYEYDKIEGTVRECFTPQADGTWRADPVQNGADIRMTVSAPDGKNQQADDIREKELKALLLSQGFYTDNAAAAGLTLDKFLTSIQGATTFDVDWFTGASLFVTFDPPPPEYRDNRGKKGFPLVSVIPGGPNGGPLEAEAEYRKIATGLKKITWGYDTKMAKQDQSVAAAGARPTGAGGMLPPGGAPSGPGGAPTGPAGPNGYAAAGPAVAGYAAPTGLPPAGPAAAGPAAAGPGRPTIPGAAAPGGLTARPPGSGFGPPAHA